MKNIITAIKSTDPLNLLKRGLQSKFFPFFTAAVTLMCYYLGWDIVLIYYAAITGTLIFLLLDDVTPVISVFLFMSVLISYENSPSNIMGNSDYYYRTGNLVQIIILIVLFGSAAVYRAILAMVRKKFKLSPLFYVLCAFAVVLLFNGLFSKDYDPKNMVYGLIMALCFLGIFSALKDNLVLNKDSFERIALSFFALSILLIIELVVAYLTTENLFVNGVIKRELLTFGWGMWNTMGMMLVICIPSVVYLAGKYKYGFAITLYSALLFAATFMSCSRQAILGSMFAYPICIIVLLIKGRNRIANICIVAAAVVAGLIMLGIYSGTVVKYFKDLFSKLFVNGEISGNGRIKLWRGGISNFKSAPFLGVGFYSEIYKFLGGNYQGYSGLVGFIPQMCHNTLVQLLSSCGIIGLLVYLVHRIQTVICFFKNITIERTFVAVTIAALLAISLVDNHIFNIFPTIIYSSLLAVLVKSEEKNNAAPVTVQTAA